MLKIRVGDIYYWCEPEGQPEVYDDRFCVVVADSDPSGGIHGKYDFGVFSRRDEKYDFIVRKCMKKELDAGRLHYIGRL